MKSKSFTQWLAVSASAFMVASHECWAEPAKASSNGSTNVSGIAIGTTKSSKQQDITVNPSSDFAKVVGWKKLKESCEAELAGDRERAVKLLGEAAAAQVPEAQFAFGARLIEKGGADEVRRGIAFWEAAAAQGEARAGHNLGLAYQWGKLVPPDPEKSERYMAGAARAGLAEAQTQMGIRARDRGDYAAARAWNEKAAAQREPQALYNLAMLCEEGKGGESDELRAAGLYRNAAELGFDLAVTNLGAMYVEGRGVPRNLVLAVAWYTVGARHLGLERCEINRSGLLPHMTMADIRFAESLAERWWEKFGSAFQTK